ncbi:hypothetical protein ABJI51_17985 [Amycolatopsis sp. NEAU-NG30]|uniref:Uncharacterized protein n=1 Tax=Amycolatopsis melonis TaxID=3156488 RepID=A0ABV0LHM0_9PSEU
MLTERRDQSPESDVLPRSVLPLGQVNRLVNRPGEDASIVSIFGASNAVQAVAGTWTGRAAAQFNTYAGTVGKALGDQQDVVGSMSGILSGIAACVIETYSKAIEFIGTCAAELGKLGYKTIVAIVTSGIPIVDIFTSKDVIDAVIDAFANLVTAITGLFNQAVSTLGNFQAQATAIVQGDTDFPDLPPMPTNSGMDNAKQWRIDPSAAPE